MSFEESIHERVVLLGGKVTGIDCPECTFAGSDVDLDAHRRGAVTCPNCGEMALTADEKAELRQNGKL